MKNNYKKICGVYKITSPSNRIYIGSSIDIYNRVCKYQNLKCTNQPKLYRSILKYGWEKHIFEIVELCTVEELYAKEAYYGELHEVLTNGLNCKLPKTNEFKNAMSQETKNKIGKANKNRFVGYRHDWYETPLKTLTREQVIDIKNLLAQNQLTQLQIAKMYNISRKTVSNINIGKSYKCIIEGADIKESKKLYIKLTEEDYMYIKQMSLNGISQKEIGRTFNIDQSHVSRIINKSNYIKTLCKGGGV